MTTTHMPSKSLLALALAALTLVGGLLVANRPVDVYSLDHLEQLDTLERGAVHETFSWINENALEHLPVAATLRLENAVAALALSLATPAAPAEGDA